MSDLQRIYRRLYRWASRRLYHELAWAYEIVAWLVSLGRWHGWRCQVLDHIAGDRVLEIGFGTGTLLEAAARRGYEVWGADPSVAMHRVAARRLRSHGTDIPRMQAMAQALPVTDGSFDTVMATFPTEYILDPATLAEVKRVLRGCREDGTRGRFLVTGLGFRAEHGGLRRFLSLVFGVSSEAPVDWYARFATSAGFNVGVVEEEVQSVWMPVLILEIAV